MRDYVRALRRGWLWMAGALLLCVGAAVAANELLPRQYTAGLTIYISATSENTTDNSNAYQGSLLAQQRVPSYQQLVTDERVTRDVVDELDLDMDPEALADKIVVSTQPNTVLLDISVTDRSPERAAAIANAVADEFEDVVADLEQPTDRNALPIVQARAVEDADPPLQPSAPRPRLNIALGIVVGLFLGGALALLSGALRGPEPLTETQPTAAPDSGREHDPAQEGPGTLEQRSRDRVG